MDKNYITTNGYQILQEELYNLLNKERPEYVRLVNWAASNGDRSENADYQYGKRKLREIDRRIYYLTKQIENAEVVDPSQNSGNAKIYFGATVTICRNTDVEQTLTIVGVDEIGGVNKHYISWRSPLAMSLLGKSSGDEFECKIQDRVDVIEIIDVVYG